MHIIMISIFKCQKADIALYQKIKFVAIKLVKGRLV